MPFSLAPDTPLGKVYSSPPPPTSPEGGTGRGLAEEAVVVKGQAAIGVGAQGFKGWGVVGEGEGGLPPALDPKVSLKARQLQVKKDGENERYGAPFFLWGFLFLYISL